MFDKRHSYVQFSEKVGLQPTNMRLSLFFVLLIGSFRFPTPSVTLTTFTIANKTLEVIQTFFDTADWFETEGEKIKKEIFVKLNKVVFEISDINEQLQDQEGQINIIPRILNNLGATVRLELNLHEIRNRQILINNYFDMLDNYIMDYDEYENSTLIDFADTVVSSSVNSVRQLIEFIYKKVKEPGFLESLSKQFKPGQVSSFCTEKQASSQILHGFLNEILMLNLRSYTLVQSAYMMKKIFHFGNFKREMDDALKNFKQRTNNLVRTFKPYIGKASYELWKCDPEKQIEGETFIQITNFLQGFILNKANLDPNGRCRDECDVFTYTTKTQCYDNEWCKQQTTCPKIVNCGYVDWTMDVCSEDMSRNSTRRYSYIEFQDGRRYGKKTVCQKRNHLETYRSYQIWNCSYCFCLCDEGPKFFSQRFINLRLAMSNITDNRVVTGLRFVKQHGIIHLQVQEGKILPHGEIDADTVRWVPPRNYSRLDSNVIEGIDYHTLSWEQRGFDLDDIFADEGYVITGVRFLKIGTRLHLEALTTHYNFTTGNLTAKRNSFQEDKNLAFKHKFGKELKLTKPDIPTLLDGFSDTFTTDQYVQFTHSDFGKDAGQTTVPFFDAQPVESTIPVPLSGIGVFHRGKKGYGGFIAPRIFTYNFTEHLQPIFPNS